MTQRRWQDSLNLILGIWLFVAPFFGIPGLTGAAAMNSYIFGFLIALFSAIALGRPQKWEEGINLLIGIWLIIAPFALGFFAMRGTAWNQIVAGIIIFVDAVWAMAQRPRTQPNEQQAA
jgi:hypothetical protein